MSCAAACASIANTNTSSRNKQNTKACHQASVAMLVKVISLLSKALLFAHNSKSDAYNFKPDAWVLTILLQIEMAKR